MNDRSTIHPAGTYANGLWNHFTKRKKYTIECGKCRHSWTEKVSFACGDKASAICPCCGSQNVWSHSEFERFYDLNMKKRR